MSNRYVWEKTTSKLNESSPSTSKDESYHIDARYRWLYLYTWEDCEWAPASANSGRWIASGLKKTNITIMVTNDGQTASIPTPGRYYFDKDGNLAQSAAVDSYQLFRTFEPITARISDYEYEYADGPYEDDSIHFTVNYDGSTATYKTSTRITETLSNASSSTYPPCDAAGRIASICAVLPMRRCRYVQ